MHIINLLGDIAVSFPRESRSSCIKLTLSFLGSSGRHCLLHLTNWRPLHLIHLLEIAGVMVTSPVGLQKPLLALRVGVTVECHCEECTFGCAMRYCRWAVIGAWVQCVSQHTLTCRWADQGYQLTCCHTHNLMANFLSKLSNLKKTKWSLSVSQ